MLVFNHIQRINLQIINTKRKSERVSSPAICIPARVCESKKQLNNY